jgi:nucleotide-binding universal stress UspA family protein
VVVGYNGTRHAREAVEWAAAEAARRNVPLQVVYAANYPGMALGPGPGLLERSPGALDAAEEVTAEGVAVALESQPGLHVTGVTEVTSPADTLVRAGAEAELLVIGTRGYGRVLGPLLRTVAGTVTARAPFPVVVVSAGAGSPRPGHVRDVVVGTDGSSGADGAVRFAAEYAAATGSPLRIVAGIDEQAPSEAGRNRLGDAAQRLVDKARRLVHGTHPGLIVTTAVEHGPAHRVLVDASRTARLLVVGSRGQGAVRAMLLGSVSRAVIGDDHARLGSDASDARDAAEAAEARERVPVPVACVPML